MLNLRIFSGSPNRPAELLQRFVFFLKGVSWRAIKHAKVDAFEVTLQHQPADDKPETERIECLH